MEFKHLPEVRKRLMALTWLELESFAESLVNAINQDDIPAAKELINLWLVEP